MLFVWYYKNHTTRNYHFHFIWMLWLLKTKLSMDNYLFCCCFDDFNEYLFFFLLGSVVSTLWIFMASLGSFVVLLVPAVLIRIKLKKQKGPENYDIIPLQEIHQNPLDLDGINSVLQEEERVYSNITPHRIPIDTFIHQVERKKICNQFSDEFQVK